MTESETSAGDPNFQVRDRRPDPDELGTWLVDALRRRGELKGALRLRMCRLPDDELPWRPLEGARPLMVDRLIRYRCEFAVRPGDDPNAARAQLERLKPSVQRALDDEDILGGLIPAGYADGRPAISTSNDGRFLTSTFEVSLVARPSMPD